MAQYEFSDLAISTSLNADITDVQTSLVLADATGYPTANFKIWINAELILVGSRSGTTCSSLTRGLGDTVGAAHTAGDAIRHVVSSEDLLTRLLGLPASAPGASEDEKVLVYDHGTTAFKWEDAATFGGAFLPLDGSENMSGPLNLGGNDIRNTPNIVSTNSNLTLQAVSSGAGPARNLDFYTDDAAGTLRLRQRTSGGGDIVFYKIDGSTTSLFWDESEDDWQFMADVDFGGYQLAAPGDPTLGTEIGDRDYNDARYVEILGDSMTGALTITTDGTAINLIAATGTGNPHFRQRTDNYAGWIIERADASRVLAYEKNPSDVFSFVMYDGAGANARTKWTSVYNSTSYFGDDETNVVHQGNPVYLRGQSSGASSANVYIQADDSGGTLRNRMYINGAGNTEFSDVAGTLIFSVATNALTINNKILAGPLDPTADTHVGDRAYNDLRYSPIVSGGFLPLSGGTMAGSIDMDGFDLTAVGTVNSLGEDLLLQATNSGAAAQDIYLSADDAGGVLRNRIIVDGDAGINFYHNDGVLEYVFSNTTLDMQGNDMGDVVNVYSVDNNLILAATNSGAAAQDVLITADDAGGVQRTRIFIDGDATTTLYRNDGNRAIIIEDENIVFRAVDDTLVYYYADASDAHIFGAEVNINGNVLVGPLDPSAGTHVGDRDYNDARYPLTSAGPYVKTDGSTDITGVQIFDNTGAGLEVRAGNNSGGYAQHQIRLGYTGASEYRHAINSRHHATQVATNAIDFLLWNYGSNAIGDVGTFVAFSIDQAGSDLFTDLDLNSNTLSNPLDPSAGTHVGDRDYNDGRYAIGATGDFVAVTGDTMTGQLAIDIAGSVVPLAITGGNAGTALATFTRDVGADGLIQIDVGNGEPKILWDAEDGTVWHLGAWADGSSFYIGQANDVGAEISMRFQSTGDIAFYKADGSTISLLWDESDDRWEFSTDIELNLAGPSLYLDRTSQASGQALLVFQTANVSYGYVGLNSVANDNMMLQSVNSDLTIQATNTGAAAQNIEVFADDASGTQRQRILIDGDGNLELKRNDATRAILVDDAGTGDILFYKADGTTTTLMWDESDDRWEFIGATPTIPGYLPLSGGTMTGVLNAPLQLSGYASPNNPFGGANFNHPYFNNKLFAAPARFTVSVDAGFSAFNEDALFDQDYDWYNANNIDDGDTGILTIDMINGDDPLGANGYTYTGGAYILLSFYYDRTPESVSMRWQDKDLNWTAGGTPEDIGTGALAQIWKIPFTSDQYMTVIEITIEAQASSATGVVALTEVELYMGRPRGIGGTPHFSLYEAQSVYYPTTHRFATGLVTTGFSEGAVLKLDADVSASPAITLTRSHTQTGGNLTLERWENDAAFAMGSNITDTNPQFRINQAGYLSVYSGVEAAATLAQRWNNDGDIMFYKTDGTTVSMRWDETDNRWETTTGLDLGGNTLSSTAVVSSWDTTIWIAAVSSGASAQDIYLKADDAAGTQTNRMFIDGDGSTYLYTDATVRFDLTGASGPSNAYIEVFEGAADNPAFEWQRWSGGASNYYGFRQIMKTGYMVFETSDSTTIGAQTFTEKLRIDTSDVTLNTRLDMAGNVLYSPLDPTADGHVGDRAYNDGRYMLTAAPPNAHTIASHSDTTGTGTELNTLTGGGDVGALHTHAAAYAAIGHTIVSHDTTTTGSELTELTDGTNADHLHIHAAGSSTLDALTDTIITSVANGEILMWSGGADWINQTFAEADIATLTYVDGLDHHTKYTDSEAAAKIAADDLYVKVDGDVMEGHLNIDDNELRFGNHPIGSADAWWFVENAGDLEFWARVNIEGWSSSLIWHVDNGQQIMDSALDMNGQTIWMNGGRIADPLDPTNGTHVGDRDYNDARYVELAGDTMGGTLNMGGNNFLSVGDPTLDTQVGDRGYNDARYMELAGTNAMTGTLYFTRLGVSGDTDTYIDQTSGLDTLSVWAGAFEMLRFTQDTPNLITSYSDWDFGGKDLVNIDDVTAGFFGIHGDADTYMGQWQGADSLEFFVGGFEMIRLTETTSNLITLYADTWRSGTAALTTSQFRNIYISDSAPGSPQTGDVWLDTDAAAGGGSYLALDGTTTMTGDIDAGGNNLIKVDQIFDAGNTKRISFDDTAAGDLQLWRSNGTTEILRWTDSLGHLQIDAVDMSIDLGTGELDITASPVTYHSPDGGNGHLGYVGGHNYFVTDTGGSTYFRNFTSPATYNTHVTISDATGVKIDISDTDGGQMRLTMPGDANSVIFRNDGTNFYYLVTDTEDGTWNSLRPFYFNLSTGTVRMNHLVEVGGNLNPTVNGTQSLGTTSLRWELKADVIDVGNEIIMAVGGSVSDPSVGWGDGDTGFWEPTDDSLRLGVASSQIILFDSGYTRHDNNNIPNVDSTYDLGHSSYWWKKAWVDDISISSRYVVFGTQVRPNDHIYHHETNNTFEFVSDNDTSHEVHLQDANYIDANESTIRLHGTTGMPTSGAASYDVYTRNDSATWDELYRYTSSLRYKQDVDDMENATGTAIDFINALRPVVYRDITEAASTNSARRRNRREVGLIAEEVAAVEPWPEAFTASMYVWPEGTEAELAHLESDVLFTSELPDTVKYKQLTMPLILVAQDHDAKLNVAQARVVDLEAKVDTLEARILALETA